MQLLYDVRNLYVCGLSELLSIPIDVMRRNLAVKAETSQRTNQTCFCGTDVITLLLLLLLVLLV